MFANWTKNTQVNRIKSSFKPVDNLRMIVYTFPVTTGDVKPAAVSY